MLFEWLADGVLGITVAGEIGDDAHPVIAASLEGLLSDSTEPIAIFWDLAEVRRWDDATKRALVHMLRRHAARIAEQHVYATVPHVRARMQILAMCLRNVTCYHTRSLFDLTLDAAVGVERRECA